jgi:hypothetical protein
LADPEAWKELPKRRLIEGAAIELVGAIIEDDDDDPAKGNDETAVAVAEEARDEASPGDNDGCGAMNTGADACSCCSASSTSRLACSRTTLISVELLFLLFLLLPLGSMAPWS